MAMPLFDGSTWSNHFARFILNIYYSKQFLAHSSGKIWRELCLFEESNCSPALIKIKATPLCHGHCTKMKLYMNDFFLKCDQIRRELRIWLHLLKKSLIENFIYYTVVQHIKLTNSIFLIRTRSDSHYLLQKCLYNYSLSLENNQGQG